MSYCNAVEERGTDTLASRWIITVEVISAYHALAGFNNYLIRSNGRCSSPPSDIEDVCSSL